MVGIKKYKLIKRNIREGFNKEYTAIYYLKHDSPTDITSVNTLLTFMKSEDFFLDGEDLMKFERWSFEHNGGYLFKFDEEKLSWNARVMFDHEGRL